MDCLLEENLICIVFVSFDEGFIFEFDIFNCRVWIYYLDIVEIVEKIMIFVGFWV